ncbi:hypothetical protein K474DRAFT_1672312 [Panus rudis PR-1116 ss-1]|nr:hypothetical protein K474DRAFT_1672312 [Panus rudis PR-1116 ss-1]
MSRPETHPPEFVDYGSFDGRDLPFSAQGFGAAAALRKYSYGRTESARDYAPLRDATSPSSFYSSAAANAILGDAAARSGAGGYGLVSPPPPRMYAQAQAQGLAGHDAWGPALVPNGTKQASAGSTAANSPTTQVQPAGQTPLVVNHHHRASPPRQPAAFSPASPTDRDPLRDLYYPTRPTQQSAQNNNNSNPVTSSALTANNPAATQRSTLWWGELEPWMDEEYAKQVCNLMGWDPVNIKVPRPAPDPLTGRQANNPGYCFLTFPSQQHAAAVLAQVNSGNASGAPVTMPNSSRPFTLNWASSVPTAPLPAGFNGQTISIPGAQNPQYPKEYSIFVGDLAPEVSNSDLVAVFRNPVLGLRNDREPRFIRPFLSCKSAKIMLDPVTGVSRGYGFVRFTDEADQQRALIEMHGLYCLSRPMRISPATAKFKPSPGVPLDYSQLGYAGLLNVAQPEQPPVTVALPLPNQTKSVSTPLASSTTPSSGSGTTLNSANGSQTLSSNASTASSSTLASTNSDGEVIATQAGNNNAGTPNAAVPSSISNGLAQPTHDQLMAQRYNIPEESWKHHAQARAILSNLIGPNGEQLTSSDPYNTTVFVGGLSPLISEETLRTFFAPFGDIHYVKVPVGKHCGFVQFVRKPDAERAIEKMQGFPIGGSRIRLSWGRSQYKAAQAAAQAAQAAALQAQYQPQVVPTNNQTSSLTADQALQLLEKVGLTQLLNNPAALQALQNIQPAATEVNGSAQNNVSNDHQDGDNVQKFDSFAPSSFDSRSSGQFGPSSFSPFSPDPNYLGDTGKALNMNPGSSPTSAPGSGYPSFPNKSYTPWYTPQQDEKVVNGSGKVSPTSVQTTRPTSAQRFGTFLGGEGTSPFQTRSSSRQEGPIARPDLNRRPSQLVMNDKFGSDEPEHDSIHDLNGTLASLNLGDHAHTHTQGSWKSGAEGPHVSS